MSRLTSRRDLLRGSAVTALASVTASVPTMAAPAAPDAVLLALCADHERAAQASDDLVCHLGDIYGADLPEEAYEQERVTFAVEIGLRDDVAEVPAYTPAGLAAKARVLRRKLGYTRDPAPDSEHGLVWSLTADLLRGIV